MSSAQLMKGYDHPPLFLTSYLDLIVILLDTFLTSGLHLKNICEFIGTIYVALFKCFRVFIASSE